MKIGNLNISNFKVGTTQVLALWLGNTKIWPETPPPPVIGYTIEGAYVSYTSAVSEAIDAGGSGYAQIKGTVKKYEDGVLVQTIPNTVLTPVLSSTSDFYKSGNRVKAYNRGTNPGSTLSVSAYGTYSGAESANVTIYQEANIETASVVYNKSFIAGESVGDVITVPYSGATYNFTASSTKTTTTTYTSGAQGTPVTENHKCQIVPDVSWYSLDTDWEVSGTISGTITFEANSTSSSRVGHISLYSGDSGQKRITISQAAPPTIEVTPSSVNISSSGGTTSFTVSNVRTYLVDINDSWIHQQSKSGNTVTLSIDINNTGEERTGTVTLVGTGGGSGQIDFTVIQAG